jgi:uncharacterized membrane protein
VQSKLLFAPLIAACMCLAVAARAETVDVTGVADDDVLNLRAEPRAGASLTGALSPTASGVEVVRRSEGWAYVKSGTQAGWASARFLRPVMSFEDGKPPSPLQCVGTEPFWSLSIAGKSATYQTPEKDAVASGIQKIVQSRNSTIVWLVRPSSGPVLGATIEARQACSDNMSDHIYSFRVTIETRDGQLLSGCCDLVR